jgi:hypothetical protein
VEKDTVCIRKHFTETGSSVILPPVPLFHLIIAPVSFTILPDALSGISLYSRACMQQRAFRLAFNVFVNIILGASALIFQRSW